MRASRSPTCKFSRAHQWSFDGGITVPASSSPLSVRVPYSRAEAVDPGGGIGRGPFELPHADVPLLGAKQGFVVDSYEDEAVGVMTKNARGKLFVSKVALRPRIAFAGAQAAERRPNSPNCIITRTRNATSPTRC